MSTISTCERERKSEDEDKSLRSSSQSSSLASHRTSRSFQEKIDLPLRSRLCVQTEETYFSGELEVSRHNGLFFNRLKPKWCVLLKSGTLFIYSDIERGLSLNLAEMRKLVHTYSEKMHGKEIKARCEFELSFGDGKLRIIAKGSQSFVTCWRRGLVTAHHSIPLQTAAETDHFTWAQPEVDPHSSDALLHSIAERTLRHNRSNPSLVYLYNNTLPSRKYSEVVSHMKKARSLDTDSRLLSTSKSFSEREEKKEIEDEKEKTASDSVLLGDPSPAVEESSIVRSNEVPNLSLVVNFESAQMDPDSGVGSPIYEEEEGDEDGQNRDLFDDADPPVSDGRRHSAFSRESQITVLNFSTLSENGGLEQCREDEETDTNAGSLWRSRLDGIPQLTTDILDFDSAFGIHAD